MVNLLVVSATKLLLSDAGSKGLPDTLQTLLTEVHQLRQDIESITVASQRMQIALFSMQMQDAAVARATARLDATRNRCTGAQSNRDHLVAEMQRMDAALSSATISSVQPAEAAEARSHYRICRAVWILSTRLWRN